MSLRYSLAIPACVVEDLKARVMQSAAALQLAKDSWGRIFLLGRCWWASSSWACPVITQFFVIVIAAFKHPGQPPGTRSYHGAFAGHWLLH
jgi:hypothetical protein